MRTMVMVMTNVLKFESRMLPSKSWRRSSERGGGSAMSSTPTSFLFDCLCCFRRGVDLLQDTAFQVAALDSVGLHRARESILRHAPEGNDLRVRDEQRGK
jgi:hypothetical protein